MPPCHQQNVGMRTQSLRLSCRDETGASLRSLSQVLLTMPSAVQHYGWSSVHLLTSMGVFANKVPTGTPCGINRAACADSDTCCCAVCS